MEAAGISFLTVHGRTSKERCEPVRLATIQTIVDALNRTTPVIANGDLDTLEKCYEVQDQTGVRGVMSARGILENPSLFTGLHEETPVSVLKRWIEINQKLDSHFTMFHRHLMSMTEKILNRVERREFNVLTTREDVVDYLIRKFEFTIEPGDWNNNSSSSSSFTRPKRDDS